jgi:hypothetical protein
VWRYVPETKGHRLEAIQSLWGARDMPAEVRATPVTSTTP